MIRMALGGTSCRNRWIRYRRGASTVSGQATAFLFLLLLFSTGVTLRAAEGTRLQELEKRVSTLEAKLDRILDLLTRDRQQTGGQVAEVQAIQAEVEEVSARVSASQSVGGQPAPGAAGQVTARVVSQQGVDPSEEVINVPYSGYMEMHVNNDGLNPTTLDFHRFVLLFGHGFGDRFRFWSELELENAFIEGGEESGELELEQAYLDYLIHPRLNFRSGMILAPVGIINERHEPPSFNGVERPFVDTVIIPSTWFGAGAGFVGDLGKGFSYKAFAMSPLNAAEFSAEEGFRGGRQKGFFENARNVALTGRLEFRGVPGLTLGTSFWTGETGFNFRDIDGRATIFEFDGRFRWDRFQGRGQFVITDLGDAADINRALRQQRGINPNIAEKMRGFYLEGGANILPSWLHHDLVPFYRYENFDTQFDMPEGFFPLKQFDRSAHVFGVSYFPYPDIAFKFDYNIMRNESLVVDSANRWNIGVGWWF